MNRPPVWAAELAARFWADAGDPPPFPRDLAGPLQAALLLSVIRIPGLSLASAADAARSSGYPFPPVEADRPLCGCLVARGETGLILVEADDPPAEQRFSVAHELAHFLRDHDAPRRKVLARLGRDAADLLARGRPPTPELRVAAAFRGVPLGRSVHLLDRDRRGRPTSREAAEAEAAADRLAWELLAPFKAVAAGSGDLVGRLVTLFGLPPGPAAEYARELAPAEPVGMVFRPIEKNR